MRKDDKKVVGYNYFNEDRLLALLCDLQNKRSPFYRDLIGCLHDEYARKLPDGFMYHDDFVVDEIKTILDSQNKIDVVWYLDRYKREKREQTLWRRIVSWLTRN